MKADSITIQDFFHTERRHVVPLYQRPYVWKREDQWEPLWEDLRQLAERSLAGRPTRPHFLGAIVLDQIKTAIKDVPVRLVIDGQQRLTSLQLLMCGLRELCAANQQEDLRRRLERLTMNDDAPTDSDQRFKVWPTNIDRPAFRELMDPKVGQSPQERVAAARSAMVGDGLLVDAYAYFYETMGAWLSEAEGEALGRRAAVLVDILRHGFNLVVIDLGEDDEAQVIFETLNARGTPLLPADLVKNHLFHAADEQKVDLEKLYEKYWKPFDRRAGFWRKLVKQGRFYRPQIDLFLQHYLTLVTRDEVSATHLFSEFKDFATQPPERSAEDHLKDLQSHALVYRRFGEAPPESRRAIFFERLAIMDTTTLIPFLLGLFHRFDAQTDDASLDAILVDLESFLVRRMVCRLTTKGYNLLFLELLAIFDRVATPDAASAEVRHVLAKQTAESRLWPDDETFETAWRDLPAYRVLSRSRIRMILEAIEATYRTELSEPIILKGKLTVEHLLPQAWRQSWPLPGDLDPKDAAARRDSQLHRFGNLTLLTKKLNPLISNGNWAKKHPEIIAHSALALNRRLQKETVWDEAAIERRAGELFERARAEWPRPLAQEVGSGHS